MSAIGTGYDLSASQYSPDGRVFQVEYAKKAVDNSANIVAIMGKDCTVIATEKPLNSKLYERDSNPRIFSVDEHISCGVVGFYPDAKALLAQARSYAQEFRQDHGYAIPITILKDRLGYYVHAYTSSSAVRPFGASLLLASYDEEPKLYMVEPCGTAIGYYYIAAGKSKQTGKAELEKLKRLDLSSRDLVKEAARIIYSVHDDVKDKAGFKLELSWVGKDTNGLHKLVPKELYDEAEQFARTSLNDDSSDEEMARE